MKLRLIPLAIARAKRFVGKEHRHHPRMAGGLWALGATRDGKLVGVVIVGRCVARELDEPIRAEVIRLATDGSRNACSFLYAAARRVWQTMGGLSLKTYNLASESGASLRAAGAKPEHRVRGRRWNCKSRPRKDLGPIADKVRWELCA